MKLFTTIFFLTLPISAVAASNDAITSSSSRGEIQTAPAAISTTHTQVGSITFSGVYSHQSTVLIPGIPGSDRKTLFGWAITPEVNFTKHLGLQADFMNSHTEDSYPGISRLMIAAGPRYTLNPFWKGTPFVFAEAGETRVTYGNGPSGSFRRPTDWNPTASVGIGMDFNVTRGFAVQVVPGEWTGERFDYNGAWQNNYMARVGFVFNLRR